ncbi:MAG: hypothetical protein A2033_11255 [Bacteroidetes bacterium GWA2_31_9]|nr:MAG: hypothetical protein A2033_11255 [Bacteroidetes bacterium GWA2_31_9]
MTIKIDDNELYNSLKQFLKSIKVEIINDEISKEDDTDFYNFASENLSKAYSENEPEYTENMINEPNVLYERK